MSVRRPQVLTLVAQQAGSLRSENAGIASPHSTRTILTNDLPNNSNVQQMINQRHYGRAGDSWSRDGGGGPDVEGAARRHQPIC